eukprot:c12655_g1_i1 orf=86-331(+)
MDGFFTWLMMRLFIFPVKERGDGAADDAGLILCVVVVVAERRIGGKLRGGSYRSTAAVAAGGVPFQWEAEPGKSKSPTIKE